jgi:hypothetical protein
MTRQNDKTIHAISESVSRNVREIHSVAGAGLSGIVACKHAMCETSFGAHIFTKFAIVQEAADVGFHGRPMIVAREPHLCLAISILFLDKIQPFYFCQKIDV